MPVFTILKEQIRQQGFITITSFMETCLYDKDAGYYMTRDPFGQEGDFTTAPEISQIFGELLGAWVLHARSQFSHHQTWHLVEGGPGRGTLMLDMLRIIKQQDPKAYDCLHVHLVEISPFLSAKQQQVLTAHKDKVTWHTQLPKELSGPVVFIGNELLDAFPVHQYSRKNGQFYERIVTLNDKDELTFSLKDSPEENLSATDIDADNIECAPSQFNFIQQLKDLVTHSHPQGCALLIDYGGDGEGHTLQGLYKHQKVSPLHKPGESDLTTHVPFDKITQAFGKGVFGPIDMVIFLMQLGLPVRAGQLIKAADGEKQRHAIESQVFRLVSPQEMGTLFKVLAWAPDESGLQLAGFE